MGLDVKQMVSEGVNSKCMECIQCGACVDECPKKVLKYSMKWRWRYGKRQKIDMLILGLLFHEDLTEKKTNK